MGGVGCGFMEDYKKMIWINQMKHKSLKISGVRVIGGWFLSLLLQLAGGFWTHAESASKKKKRVLCVLGSTKSEIVHLGKLINRTFQQQMPSFSETSPHLENVPTTGWMFF